MYFWFDYTNIGYIIKFTFSSISVELIFHPCVKKAKKGDKSETLDTHPVYM
jgi:hypothetical protein